MVLFSKPPVVEVVLGVQFDRTSASVGDLGGFAATMGDEYPDKVDAPSIPRMLEPPQGGGFVPSVRRIIEIRGSERLQMYAPDRRHFLQVQTDRLHANWQRLTDADTYPHFEGVWAKFLAGWQRWKSFCGDAQPSPVQYEITYINHVFAGDLWNVDKSVSSVCPWLVPPKIQLEPDVEAGLHYWVPECRGRIHVVARTARKLPDMRPVFVLELTLRGANGAPGSDADLRTWMVTAHERIRASFLALTSADAHRAWGMEKPS